MAEDERAAKLADLVLDYSVELNEGDKLLVQFDPAFSGYAYLIGQKARTRGASVRYDPLSYDPNVQRYLLENFDKYEWKEDLDRRIELANWCNKKILVDTTANPNYALGIEDSEARIAAFSREVIGPYKEVYQRKTPAGEYEVKWNLVGFPYEMGAKTAGMSMDEYTEFVYTATIGNDWREMGKNMTKIKSVIDGAHDVHILVPELTDLHLCLDGRGGKICDGKLNMPDGEVFYAPLEDSANGRVYFSIPAYREGFGVVEGITLQFQAGIVTGYAAKSNQKALEESLNIDDGAKRIGEFGIGCNDGIERPTLEILFDEKIGGTIHLAIGYSYDGFPLSEGGGLNVSKIHWDLICDLRRNPADLAHCPGGEIYVDGKLVQKDGAWKI
jgi:aminopeptidase